MLNKCCFIGNLGRDPEVRQVGGKKVVNLSLAVSERWKNAEGERQERTEWVKVVIWNEKIADVAERYLSKGSKVYVEGQLQTRKWTGNDGVEKYTTEVVLQRFRGELVMLGDKGDAQPKAAAKTSSMDLDDEIPF